MKSSLGMVTASETGSHLVPHHWALQMCCFFTTNAAGTSLMSKSSRAVCAGGIPWLGPGRHRHVSHWMARVMGSGSQSRSPCSPSGTEGPGTAHGDSFLSRISFIAVGSARLRVAFRTNPISLFIALGFPLFTSITFKDRNCFREENNDTRTWKCKVKVYVHWNLSSVSFLLALDIKWDKKKEGLSFWGGIWAPVTGCWPRCLVRKWTRRGLWRIMSDCLQWELAHGDEGPVLGTAVTRGHGAFLVLGVSNQRWMIWCSWREALL